MLKRFLLICLAAGVLVAASPTFAGHSGTSRFPNPDPDPRIGTPDDPDFDCAEPDDQDEEDEDVPKCSSVFSEQWELLGFAPFASRASALYHDPDHLSRGELSQRSGVSADRAWKITTGSPEVVIAIIDTGIRWERSELRLKVWLNRGELPVPQRPDGSTAPAYDANGDGAFNADDYAGDARVNPSAGPNGMPGLVDGQDLIRTFSDGTDGDDNGYVDDIAGWDWFDDDNDPFDASSYSSANNHGSGRAEDAAAQTDNGEGGAAPCPKCQVMMLRLWDTFVAPGDTYAMATLYAADNGASVQEVALGVLQNSRFAQAATQYAFRKGVALMQVSSDLNTNNHNYPTNYNNTVFVAGSVADTHGLGVENEGLAGFLSNFEVGAVNPVATWFRNSNVTQFGGHAHIVMMGDTGSHATGQAAGAAGLVMSRGLELTDEIGGPLTSNEVKQLMTATAEDVLPENTVGTGIPDPAQPGWDQHFGYGRVDLGAAVARVAPGRIPPEAGIESPPWFMPLDPVRTPSVPIAGFAGAERASSFEYEVAFAPGLEPLEQAFTVFQRGSGEGSKTGTLGTLPLAQVAQLLPGSAEGVPPVDPHQYAFTVRLRVRDDFGNIGEDRKTLFAYHDPTLHAGWPKFVDSGGEQSLRFADLDGDGRQEVIAASSSGEIAVYNHNGAPARYFNGGKPFSADVPPFIARHLGAPAFTSGGIAPGRGGFATPAVGDLDRDGYAEIVAANGEKVYALRGDGTLLPGFPVSINPAFSAPASRTKTNHLKTGIFSSPALGDLDKDGRLDIVVAAMDQRAYAWNMEGDLLAGWPVFMRDPEGGSGEPGAESINTPALADINGDGFLEVIAATNEVYGASAPGSIEEAIREGLINLANGVAGFSSRLYAIHHDGTAHDGDPSDDGGLVVDRDAFLAGWPATLNGLSQLLPLVGPGVDAVVADIDPTVPGPEVINGAFTGDWVVLGRDGTAHYSLNSAATAGTNLSPGAVLNTVEHAAVGDVLGTGQLSIYKGGIPIELAVDLLLAGQNIPFTHQLQGWNAATGQALPGWPRAIDDYQLFTSPAIANVGGGPEREVIQGSGLYLLHAFGPTGVEPPNFPKFTGGWISGVPPVADIDGDGLLEIANWTREGNLFLWDTDAPACGGNDEWWGFRHDDHNSGVYGNDTRAPSAIRNLTLDSQASASGAGSISVNGSKAHFGLNVSFDNGDVDGRLLFEDKGKGLRVRSKEVAALNSARGLTLRWTAPGDDARCGQAQRFEVRASTSPMTADNWPQATLVAAGTPPPAGSPQAPVISGLAPGSYDIAVRAIDESGNLGPLSNIVSTTVVDLPAGQAVFWGTASIDGQAGHSFVVLVEDNGEPGKGADRLSIWLDTGYNVAPTTLADGNIQLRTAVEDPSPETLTLWQLLFTPEDVLFLLE